MQSKRQCIALVAVATAIVFAPDPGEAEPRALVQDDRAIAVAYFKVKSRGAAKPRKFNEIVESQ